MGHKPAQTGVLGAEALLVLRRGKGSTIAYSTLIPERPQPSNAAGNPSNFRFHFKHLSRTYKKLNDNFAVLSPLVKIMPPHEGKIVLMMFLKSMQHPQHILNLLRILIFWQCTKLTLELQNCSDYQIYYS